jgi:hypothetical protein
MYVPVTFVFVNMSNNINMNHCVFWLSRISDDVQSQKTQWLCVRHQRQSPSYYNRETCFIIYLKRHRFPFSKYVSKKETVYLMKN